MGIAMKTSKTALATVGRILSIGRDQIQSEWTDWIVSRLSSVQYLRRQTIERQVDLLNNPPKTNCRAFQRR